MKTDGENKRTQPIPPEAEHRLLYALAERRGMQEMVSSENENVPKFF